MDRADGQAIQASFSASGSNTITLPEMTDDEVHQVAGEYRKVGNTHSRPIYMDGMFLKGGLATVAPSNLPQPIA